jgi:hypothetical protein
VIAGDRLVDQREAARELDGRADPGLDLLVGDERPADALELALVEGQVGDGHAVVGWVPELTHEIRDRHGPHGVRVFDRTDDAKPIPHDHPRLEAERVEGREAAEVQGQGRVG